MGSLEYDSRPNRAELRRPPPVIVIDPPLGSPGPGGAAMSAAMVPVSYGPMMPGQAYNSPGGIQRLPPPVLHALAALAGPSQRQPLVYTGDTAGSLAALRQDMVDSYRALCGALGEPGRGDLMSGNLPMAAALGINVPLALPPPSSAAARLPPLLTGGGAGPLLLIPSASSPGHGAGVAMGLGSAIGIEGVGSGADAPARMLAAGSIWGAGGRGYGGAMGALRSLSAGNPSPYTLGGLPPMPLSGGGQQHWPMGRPSWARSAGGPASAGPMALGDGPRVGMLSGFSRPQDPGSDFLGEESAIVYPPPGRSYGGGPSAAARAGRGGAGLAGGAMIDPMDDFRFRGGGRRNVTIEELDDPLKPVPGYRRNDDGQLDQFLKEYARDSSKPPADLGGNSRYRMPF